MQDPLTDRPAGQVPIFLLLLPQKPLSVVQGLLDFRGGDGQRPLRPQAVGVVTGHPIGLSWTGATTKQAVAVVLDGIRHAPVQTDLAPQAFL